MADNQAKPISKFTADVSAIEGAFQQVAKAATQTSKQVTDTAVKAEEEAVKGIRAALARVKVARREELSAMKSNLSEAQKYWDAERKAAEDTISDQRKVKTNTEAMTRALKDAEMGNKKY